MTMVGNDIDDTGESIQAAEGNAGGAWHPPCWSKSPEQLADEAKALNHAGYASAAANAGKHSNPPQWAAGREM